MINQAILTNRKEREQYKNNCLEEDVYLEYN